MILGVGFYRIFYPTWRGTGIKHDPTYVAYYVPNLLANIKPSAFPIIIVYIAAAVAAVGIIAAVFAIKRTRWTGAGTSSSTGIPRSALLAKRGTRMRRRPR